MYKLSNFYNFLKTKIYNNIDYIIWTNSIINNKHMYSNGRFEHGIYSNQIIIAYFLVKMNIPYENTIPLIACYLNK